MSAVTNKLKSKSGISLAIALVFFLLCAMVGMVVLAAASVSAGKTARERQTYRQTLAMTSAAEMLRQEIQGMTFTGAYTRTEKVTTTTPDISETEGKTTVVTEEFFDRGKAADGNAPTLTGSDFLKEDADWLTKLAELYYYSCQEAGLNFSETIVSPAPAETQITFQAADDQNIPEVTAVLSAASDYTLTVVLRCGDSRMTMVFPPQTAVSTAVGEPGIVQSESGKTSVKTTVTTYTTALTWEAPLSREGGTP